MPVVAQQAQSITPVLLWLGALIVVLVVGAVVLTAVRRRLLGDRAGEGGTGLSLHDLREMHARGDLSDDEFARAKAALLGRPTVGAAPGERRAPPGYDLTGERLPGSGENDPRR